MKIGITINKRSYTPEAYAYKKYLEKHQFSVQLSDVLDDNNDANIYFMGIRSLFNKKNGRAKEIHEYQSLSTPPYARTKNFVKRLVNRPPTARIFLNEIVASEMQFNDHLPFIYREMGVDEEFFQKPNDVHEYDIVYCGSISNRVGLIEEIKRLSIIGLKILIIGDISLADFSELKKHRNISCTGRVDRNSIPSLYKKCRFGLNFTPNIYPFNIQTSTKTLEYIASGLNIISNRYQWIENLSTKYEFPVVWSTSINKITDLDSEYKFYNNNWAENFSWNTVLEKSNFKNFLLNI